MNQHPKRHQILRIIRAMSLICVVLVFILHQVPENTTEAQTTEIDVCEDVGYGPCSVEWSPRYGWLLIRSLYRIQDVHVDRMNVIFSYAHEGAWVEKWRPDGQAFATASYHSLLVRSSVISGDYPLLSILEELNFVEYENDLLENEGIDARGDPTMVSWHPDGTKLAFIHGHLSVWDIEADSVTLVRSLDDFYAGQGYLVAVAWSPDGQYIALSSPYEFILLDGETYAEVWHIRYAQSFQFSGGFQWIGELSGDFEWSLNRQQVAIGLRRYLRPFEPAQVIVIDIETRGIETIYSTEARSIGGVAWSSDGQWLTAGTGSADRRNEEHGYVENALRIWNVETGELVEMVSNDAPITSVDWRTDSSQIAFSDSEGHIYIHNFAAE